ncbi:lysophospholipid acyltransferase family protein [Noviherbaspirillum suwonense]|uniref:1-acyl-sn-glycerol-3-phosphate acyltransferase n=1 Tax=Noviherbaspirillum suwonense TaxID=1224511 RepID=A0ABY1PV17_9BURK|nr:lysophospholipid acyltransferase family protein [Noviherbaspirillum suwonense]SMP49796.1 1-acyl-sn-glycerol-3-phosphate acyltransferase [Noviherbaspirillum suwonense]
MRAGAEPGRLSGWLSSTYAWSLAAVLLPVFVLLIMALRRPALARPVARAGARLLFRLAGMPVAARGLERLPGVPHILLVNHSSFIDGIALVALLPPTPGYAFVVRQQFPVQRLLCPLLRALGTVVLMPAGAGSHAGNAALLVQALRRRGNLVIFPEAGFVPEPGLRRFHSGAFVAARRTGAPLVTAGLRGARLALKPRRWLLVRATMSLDIGAVLDPRHGDMRLLMAAARAALLRLSGEPDAGNERQRVADRA